MTARAARDPGDEMVAGAQSRTERGQAEEPQARAGRPGGNERGGDRS